MCEMIPRPNTWGNVILSLVKAFLSRDEVLVKLPGRLGIVAFGGIRLRPK